MTLGIIVYTCFITDFKFTMFYHIISFREGERVHSK